MDEPISVEVDTVNSRVKIDLSVKQFRDLQSAIKIYHNKKVYYREAYKKKKEKEGKPVTSKAKDKKDPLLDLLELKIVTEE